MASLFIDRAVGSREFRAPLRRLGLPARLTHLQYADFSFYGNGPSGRVPIGIERKRVDEIVEAVKGDVRFKGRQLPGLIRTYTMRGGFVYVIVEGLTKVDVWSGILQQGKEVKQGRMAVFYDAGWGRSRDTYERYQKFLNTLRLKGCVHIVQTANQSETALLIHALYGWFQKPWSAHSSVYAVDEQQPDSAILDERTLRRQTFAQWPGIGWRRSALVCQFFPSIASAACASEREWREALQFKEGRLTARKLVRVLRGEDDTDAKG